MEELSDLLNYVDSFLDRVKNKEGCSDGSCIINPPKGMQTNGGCNCRRDISDIKRMIERIRR